MAMLLGFDIGGTKCAAVLGRACEGLPPVVLARETFATKESPRPADAIARLCDLASRMMRTHEVDVTAVRAGVSCGGPLDAAAGVVQSPPNLPGWDEVPVVTMIRQKLGVQANLENDANASTLAEWQWGAARGAQTAAFLTFGTGLGAGLIINGKLHRGITGMAGELGHWRLAADGPVGYGKRGSFEGFCSGGGLSQLATAHPHARGDVPMLATLARQGDRQALDIFRHTGQRLGQGLALLVDLLNPEVIVLGSIFVRCEDLLRQAMEEVLCDEALPGAMRGCRVAPAMLGERIGDYAAMAAAMER